MNPIVQALRQVIGLLEPESTVNGFAWSSSENIVSRWEQQTASPCIVVADGSPPRNANDAVAIDPYLTPYDWAAVQTISNDHPPTIVLVEPTAPHEPRSDGERFFALAPDRQPTLMPNVSVLRPFGPSLVRIAVDVWNQLATPTPPTKEQRDYLRRCWQSTLIQTAIPDDHHAIANLVGPMALWEEGPWDEHARALRQMLRLLELFPPATPETTTTTTCNWEQSPGSNALQSFPDREPLRLLLLDDVAIKQHWATILQQHLQLTNCDEAATIGAIATRRVGKETINERPIELHASESPEAIHHLLKPDATLPDVLFLDLRLFQGKGLNEERTFYTTLLTVAEQYIDDRGTRQPWVGFTTGEVERMNDWLANGQRGNNADYHLILTLPARLLALRHPLLPIVLFSSTAKRSMLEHVKRYGIIHTALAKPYLPNTDGDHLRSDFGERLWHAINTALPIAAGQRVINKLRAAVKDTKKIEPFFTHSSSPDNHYHVELFLDEQGESDKTLKVSGVLLIFANATPATINAFHQTFTDDYNNWTMPKAPAVTQPSTPPVAGNPLAKKKSKPKKTLKYWLNACGADIARRLDESVNKHGIFSAVVTLEGSLKDSLDGHPIDSDELHDERVGDNLNRRLLLMNMELAIYGLARLHIPPKARVTFSIYGSTRGIPLEANKEEQVEKLWLRWGMRSQWVGTAGRVWDALDAVEAYLKDVQSPSQQMETILIPLKNAIAARTTFMTNPATEDERDELRQKIRYTDEGSIRPLVQEVMHQHVRSSFRPTATLARAYNINNVRALNKQGGRTLHAFADLVGDSDSWLEPLRQRGYQEQYGLPFRTHLHAMRFYLRGQLPEALAEFTLFDVGQSRFSMQLAHELVAAVDTMSGAELLRFSQRRHEHTVPTIENGTLSGTLQTMKNGQRCVVIGPGHTREGEELRVNTAAIASFNDGTPVQFRLARHVIPELWEAIEVQPV